VLKKWLALKFESHSTHKMDLQESINHSLREGWRVFSKLRNMYGSQQNQQPPKVEAKGINSPFQKLVVR
jgi:hypothetical protein